MARATVGDRRLLLADEPTGALDSHTGDAILAALRELADAGMAIVLVTHEARHAGWADRVVFLRDGKMIDQTHAHDDPDEFLTTALCTARRGLADPEPPTPPQAG
jgi:putative ABC transport system ATP-binding protein